MVPPYQPPKSPQTIYNHAPPTKRAAPPILPISSSGYAGASPAPRDAKLLSLGNFVIALAIAVIVAAFFTANGWAVRDPFFGLSALSINLTLFSVLTIAFMPVAFLITEAGRLLLILAEGVLPWLFWLACWGVGIAVAFCAFLVLVITVAERFLI